MLLLYINLYTFIIGVSKAAYVALFNLYLKSLSYGNVVLGNATLYYSLGLALGGLTFSTLSDHIGRKRILVITMPIYSIIGLVRLIHMPYFALYLTSFLFGLFDTSVVLPSISVIEGSDENNRLKNSNINFAIVMITGVLGYFGAGLLSEKIGLLNTLRLSMMLSFFSIVPLIPIKNVKASLKKRVISLTLPQFIIYLYYIISGSLVSLAAGVFINFGNVIFFDLFSFSTSMITLVLSVSQLSTAATSLVSHKITSRYGYKLSLFLLYSAVTVLIFLMPIFMMNSVAFTVAYILRYVLLNITTPIYMVFCLSYLPKTYLATFSGFSYFINSLMRAFSAQIFTLLSKSGTTNYSKLFFITGLFYLFNTILTIIVFALVYISGKKNIQISFASFGTFFSKAWGRNGKRVKYNLSHSSKQRSKFKSSSVSIHVHNFRHKRPDR
ncbi:MAG: MFS transporter [Fervidobacterium sp.]